MVKYVTSNGSMAEFFLSELEIDLSCSVQIERSLPDFC